LGDGFAPGCAVLQAQREQATATPMVAPYREWEIAAQMRE